MLDAPELVNEDPMSDGWMIKVEIKEELEMDGLMTETEYKSYIEEKA